MQKKTNSNRIQSSLSRICNFGRVNNLPIIPKNKTITSSRPPWYLHSNCFITSLSQYPKNTTPPNIYRKCFQEIINRYTNYKLLYTDGSKNEQILSYSITTENTIIKASILPSYSSVFSAEIIAIFEAIKHIKKLTSNNIICTD